MCRIRRGGSEYRSRGRSANSIGILPLVAAFWFPASLPAAWQPTGPFGGEAQFIAASPVQRDFLITATRSAILYESLDGGSSWKHIHFPRQLSAEMHTLQLDPQQKGTWYIGLEDRVASQSGLYRTMDGGETWTQLPGLRGMAVWSVALWAADPHVMAAGTADGIYLSADGGEAWNRISPEDDKELRPVVSLAFHPFDQKTLYAGTTHLPWRTTDGGATWTSIHDGMLDDSDVFSIAVDRGRPDVILASACSGVYRSYNGGRLWTRLPTPPGAFRVYQVASAPRNPDTVFAATSSGLLRSADRGISWRKASTSVVKSIAFDPAEATRVYAASVTSGILTSTDGGVTFRETNRGFSGHNLTTLVGAGGVLYTSSIYEGEGGGIFRSDDLGRTWRLVAGGAALAGENLRFVIAAPGRPDLLFAAALHSLLKSVDGGRTWVHVPTPGGQAIRALQVLAGTNREILAGTASGLFRMSDGGNLWKSVILDSTRPGPQIQWIQPSGDTAIAVGTDRGAYLSSDAGRSWVACTRPLEEAQWYGLATDSKSAGVALAATSHGLFRSADGCRSWDSVRTGGRGTVAIVVSHPTRAGMFIAAQDGQLFLSGDGGIDWQPAEEEGHEASYPSALVILPSSPEELFTLLPRRGVFRIGPLGRVPARQ